MRLADSGGETVFPPVRAPDRVDDVDLVAGMTAGDEGALVSLYDRWASKVYAVIVELLRKPDDAEDVLEETFWQAWRTAPAFARDRTTVGTWLFTIGRSKALEHMRARRRGETPVGARKFTEPAQESLDARDPMQQRVRSLTKAVRELPPEERRVLEMAYLNGMRESDIATRTGVPAETVKTRIRSGMRHLRDRLAEVREDSDDRAVDAR
jgi:RNA polymerase sigma-70 factor, ECF subfamily